jgi:hypothetical protein
VQAAGSPGVRSSAPQSASQRHASSDGSRANRQPAHVFWLDTVGRRRLVPLGVLTSPQHRRSVVALMMRRMRRHACRLAHRVVPRRQRPNRWGHRIGRPRVIRAMEPSARTAARVLFTAAGGVTVFLGLSSVAYVCGFQTCSRFLT